MDNKRGFKDFKLGDAYKKWAGYIHLIKDDGTKKQYLYTGNCCTTLFDYKVEKIDLIFYNGILGTILVELETWDKPSENNHTAISQCLAKYDKLNENFKRLFNAPSHINNDASTGKSTYSWQTNKTYLATIFNYLGASKGCSVDVTIVDPNFLKKDIQEGF